VEGLTGAKAVSAGYAVTAAVDSEGHVHMFGPNGSGEQGHGRAGVGVEWRPHKLTGVRSAREGHLRCH